MPSKKVIFIELEVNVLRILTLAFHLMLCSTSRFCCQKINPVKLSLVLCLLMYGLEFFKSETPSPYSIRGNRVGKLHCEDTDH